MRHNWCAGPLALGLGAVQVPRPCETVSKPYKTCADGLIARRGRFGSARTTVQAVKFFRFSCLRQVIDLSPQNSRKMSKPRFWLKAEF